MSGEIHNYLQCSKDWLLLLVIIWIFAKQVDVDSKNQPVQINLSFIQAVATAPIVDNTVLITSE